MTSKGQVTIPVELRVALAIDEGTYLAVSDDGDEIRLRKIVPALPLGREDPIWTLVGAGESVETDVSTDHDRHLAAGETARWRESS